MDILKSFLEIMIVFGLVEEDLRIWGIENYLKIEVVFIEGEREREFEGGRYREYKCV